MARKKKLAEEIKGTYQTATTVISAQPLQATEAFIDLSLMTACIAAAKMAIETSSLIQTNLRKFAHDEPMAYTQLASASALLGPLGILGIGLGFFTKKDGKQVGISEEIDFLKDFDMQKWAMAIIVGILAYGTLKYAGASIVDGVFGAVNNGFKTVGLLA